MIGNTDPMTAPLDLDALSAALAKATPGPWECLGGLLDYDGARYGEPAYILSKPGECFPVSKANAELICLLTAAAPQMIAEITALREERGRLREALERIENGEAVSDWADQPHEQMQDTARAALNPEGAAS